MTARAAESWQKRIAEALACLDVVECKYSDFNLSDFVRLVSPDVDDALNRMAQDKAEA